MIQAPPRSAGSNFAGAAFEPSTRLGLSHLRLDAARHVASMRALVFLPPARLAHFAHARLTTIHPDVVPDSVDPAAASLDDWSVSEVDVPPGVPWEVLHPRLLDETRAEESRKRVRIDSPVVVIETPTRPVSIAPAVPDRLATETTEEEEGDTSKVVVGPDSDEDVSPDISLLHKVPAVRAGGNTASVDEGVRLASQSASSLQVRPPRPAYAPPPTCRFTFFRRTSCVSSASVSAAQTTTHDASEAPPPEHEADVDHPAGGVKLLRTLPAMNAYEASFHPPSAGDGEGEASLGDSIVPPPTLHFTLAQITPLSSILSPLSLPRRDTPVPPRRASTSSSSSATWATLRASVDSRPPRLGSNSSSWTAPSPERALRSTCSNSSSGTTSP